MGAESYLPESPVPLPVPDPRASLTRPPSGHRTHLVVVRTRPAAPASSGELVTRYWHPGRRAWQEQTFESLEHAMHLFVEENGWVLRQQQLLDRAGHSQCNGGRDTEEQGSESSRKPNHQQQGD